MAIYLTYHLQSGSLTVMAGAQRLSLSTERGTSHDLGHFSKVQGLEVRWEVVDYQAGGRDVTFNVQRRTPGLRLPLPATCRHYTTKKNIIFVDDGGPGFLIHGWPPCIGARCSAVRDGWETLFSTLAKERRGPIRIL